MPAFEAFEQVRRDRHSYAQGWKARTGGKIAGFFCTYVPEELLYAAGVLPVRIYGSHEPADITEPHVASQWCPFSRGCLAQTETGLLCKHLGMPYMFYEGNVTNPRELDEGEYQARIDALMESLGLRPVQVGGEEETTEEEGGGHTG